MNYKYIVYIFYKVLRFPLLKTIKNIHEVSSGYSSEDCRATAPQSHLGLPVGATFHTVAVPQRVGRLVPAHEVGFVDGSQLGFGFASSQEASSKWPEEPVPGAVARTSSSSSLRRRISNWCRLQCIQLQLHGVIRLWLLHYHRLRLDRHSEHSLQLLPIVWRYDACAGHKDLHVGVVIIAGSPRTAGHRCCLWLLQLFEYGRDATAAIALEAAWQLGPEIVALGHHLLLLLALLLLLLLWHLDQYEVIVEQADIRHLLALLLLPKESVQIDTLRIDAIILSLSLSSLLRQLQLQLFLLLCHKARDPGLGRRGAAATCLPGTWHVAWSPLSWQRPLAVAANAATAHTTPVTMSLLQDSGEDACSLG